SLHKHTFGLMPNKVTYVALDHAQVGHWQLIAVEVDVVVPDRHVLTDLSPAVGVLAERAVVRTARVVKRVKRAAFDAAQLNLHVALCYDGSGRPARIPVTERSYFHVRVYLADFRRHRVDERQQRTHRRAFARVDRGALGAAAVFVVVVLAYRDTFKVWIGLEL